MWWLLTEAYRFPTIRAPARAHSLATTWLTMQMARWWRRLQAEAKIDSRSGPSLVFAMNARTLLKLIAVMLLGLLTIFVYHPRFKRHSVRVAGFESAALAQSIADHGEFSNPFYSLNTGPSAHLAPLYPAYLALFIKVFRSDQA